MMNGEKIPVQCNYRCIRSCNPATVPYCIARALGNAVDGDTDNAVIFAGGNVGKIKEIVPVQKLVDQLVEETIAEL